jgi:predicted SnoaL-like aldol condensation-catalyzing enzyme
LEAALDKYVAEDMIQRSPGIGPGRRGLAEHLKPVVAGYDRRFIRPMRGFEDGSMVFLHTFHCYGLRQVEQVSIDIFDTDPDDHIIEHWNVTTPLRSGTCSGWSQIDGPACITDPATSPLAIRRRSEASKAVVRAYIEDVLIDGNIEHLRSYVVTDGFAQHDPDVGAGVPGLEAMDVRYVGVDVLIGADDFVATTGRCTAGSRAYAVSDLFRVDRDRIVEHWSTTVAAA